MLIKSGEIYSAKTVTECHDNFWVIIIITFLNPKK